MEPWYDKLLALESVAGSSNDLFAGAFTLGNSLPVGPSSAMVGKCIQVVGVPVLTPLEVVHDAAIVWSVRCTLGSRPWWSCRKVKKITVSGSGAPVNGWK